MMNPAGTQSEGQSGDGETYLIKCATVRSSDHGIEKFVQEYFDRLEEESGGRLTLSVFGIAAWALLVRLQKAAMQENVGCVGVVQGNLTVYAPVAEILTNPPFLYGVMRSMQRVFWTRFGMRPAQ